MYVSPQLSCYQRYPKSLKVGFTHFCNEPHQAVKTLNLSHFFILLQNTTQIPIAYILNSHLYYCNTYE